MKTILQVTKNSSPRERVIKRTFNMAMNQNLCDAGSIHNYSRWAKGKSESMIIAFIDSGNPIPIMEEHT